MASLFWYWYCPECDSRQHKEQNPLGATPQDCRACGEELMLVGQPHREGRKRPVSSYPKERNINGVPLVQ